MNRRKFMAGLLAAAPTAVAARTVAEDEHRDKYWEALAHIDSLENSVQNHQYETTEQVFSGYDANGSPVYEYLPIDQGYVNLSHGGTEIVLNNQSGYRIVQDLDKMTIYDDNGSPLYIQDVFEID